MPAISDKGHRMPESPIRKLVPYAEAAKARGVQVLHLNIGQPDIPTPDVALEAIRNNDLRVVEYSHSAGFASYRKGLADYYTRHGIHLTAEQVMVTTGG
ncbi:MAG: pyridoxal phosphate-dependent aminotransferase, partial [Flavobacteriales bacterium]|nr:pyridoxal phosphate-dependent aminotransferase [Flavobacteriales bacterium]